jgi:cytoskeleton protein RodZ
MKEVFQAGFGARLKAAREAGNLSLADVAAKLKLTARQVEALEQEEFSHLPSEVFVRGFVRNYARLVGIEPDSLIAPIDVQAAVSETITAPNAGLNVGPSNFRLWLVYPAIGVTLFLILVAALYHWLRQGEDTLIETPPEAVSQVESTSLPVDAPKPVEPASPVSEPQITLLPPPVVNPPVSSLAADSAPAPGNAAPTPPAQPTPAVKPAAPAIDVKPLNADANVKVGLRTMRFEPAQDAWIQVVDGKGKAFSKLVRAGSAESFAGEPPFRLVVGEAALVKLTYNGHSIDLTPFIGQKVARLTLE